MKIRLGVSSCLLGQRVRYDGDHKRDCYVNEVLARYFDFVPVCPEMAIGLGVPRPPIRLVGPVSAPRAVGVDDVALDVTDLLAAYGRRQGRALTDISGYLLKSRSPSCGMGRVKVYPRGRGVHRSGTGIYAAAFRSAQPLLPMEEERRLDDPAVRDNFLERVFAYSRWQRLHATGITSTRLAEFLAVHELALMAHGLARPTALERLVVRAHRYRGGKTAACFIAAFMSALARPATRRMHANVLRHVSGRFRRRLDAGDRAELRDVIAAYGTGALPLLVPITLLRHHLRRCPDPRLSRQVYLCPDAPEMALRYAA